MTPFTIPNISGTPEQQLNQIKNFLYQVIPALDIAQQTLEKTTSSLHEKLQSTIKENDPEKDAIDTFNNLKTLIIKSADIYEAFSDEINKTLEGRYVAQSDFATYAKKTSSEITANSESIIQNYSSVESIIKNIKEEDLANMNTSIDGLNNALNNLSEIRHNNCYIKTGWLDDNNTVAGVEVGVSRSDGTKSDTGFAQFTSDYIAFFNENGFANTKLSPTLLEVENIKVTKNIELGNYILNTEDGLAFIYREDT